MCSFRFYCLSFSCFFLLVCFLFSFFPYFLLLLHRYFPLPLSFTSCFISTSATSPWIATHSKQYRFALACCMNPSAAVARYVKCMAMAMATRHITHCWQFVLVIDDTVAERLYQSINCSTVYNKYVFWYSVCWICTGVHLLQMSCCCRIPDHELHGVRTVLSFRLLFIIQKSVSK